MSTILGLSPDAALWAALGLFGVCLVLALAAFALWWRASEHAAVALKARADAAPSAFTAGDAVTGLVSRPDFEGALDKAVKRCDAKRSALCLLFIDVDDFSDVNDALGHEAGDELLHEVALRLHAATPAKRSATRVAGDEFLVLLTVGESEVQAQAQLILEALARPLASRQGREFRLSASIGIAAYPAHGARAGLVSKAHAAMRTVKQTGGGAWASFNPQMAVDQRAQAALLADLRIAAQSRQFELFYQPKVDARTLQVTAAEALLRWHHPQKGVISPNVFIPLAERNGLIGDIGNWVIEEACRQAGSWRTAGFRMRVAINLSAYQMRQDDLVQRIEAALASNRLRPERFTVEITESLALENTRATQRTFEAMRSAGLHVAIDDFGAGQTSLAYLRQLPASELKMDISLVNDLAASADARAIAQAVIKLAHALDLRVVAEGVETEQQRDLLVRMGCDELQGFLFAKPMSAAALGLWAMDDEFSHRPAFSSSLFQDTRPAS